MQSKCVGVYVCVNNLYKNVSKTFEGKKLDYSKYLDYVSDHIGNIIIANAYLSIYEGSQKFIKAIRHYGFDAIFNNQVNKYKWNVGLTVDVLKDIDKIDTIILGSSSIEFIPLIKELREKNIKVILFSSRITTYLRNYCDDFVEIDRTILEE